jgi:hypothetical protein
MQQKEIEEARGKASNVSSLRCNPPPRGGGGTPPPAQDDRGARGGDRASDDCRSATWPVSSYPEIGGAPTDGIVTTTQMLKEKSERR